jgi:hypothetical protein
MKTFLGDFYIIMMAGVFGIVLGVVGIRTVLDHPEHLHYMLLIGVSCTLVLLGILMLGFSLYEYIVQYRHPEHIDERT